MDENVLTNFSTTSQMKEETKRSTGFQTFLMTGDAIIQVDTPSKPKSPRIYKTDSNQTASLDTTNNYIPFSQPRESASDILGQKEIFSFSSAAPHSVQHESEYDKRVFIPTFIVPDNIADSGPSSSEEITQESKTKSSSCSSLSSIDDISLDMNKVTINTGHVDEPSASRLAKRLFYLEGFKRSDVSQHLTRNNVFTHKVAEEYLKFFDFTGLSIVEAMRKFFSHFALCGETQERERVLLHFTRRFLSCNQSVLGSQFKSEDACHTFVCSLMLLNTDLHGPNIGKRMTLSDFMENLAGFNQDSNFPKEILKSSYVSVKNQPFTWARDEIIDGNNKPHDGRGNEDVKTRALESCQPKDLATLTTVRPSQSLISVQYPDDATEYKRGVLLRKWCKGPGGVKVGIGKRSWKRYYVILKDMVLYMLKSEKSSLTEKTAEPLLLHHSLASVARTYKKKSYVFQVHTADSSEYLFSTSSAIELEDWVNTINLVAASLSAEPLSAAVGSQKKFHKPLLPSSQTKLSLGDQCRAHEEKVTQLRKLLAEEDNYKPDNKMSRTLVINQKEKLIYLKHELQRYVVYAQLLRSKLDIFPDLDLCIARVAIREADEARSTSSAPASPERKFVSFDSELERRGPGHRYSYQQAVLYGSL